MSYEKKSKWGFIWLSLLSTMAPTCGSLVDLCSLLDVSLGINIGSFSDGEFCSYLFWSRADHTGRIKGLFQGGDVSSRVLVSSAVSQLSPVFENSIDSETLIVSADSKYGTVKFGGKVVRIGRHVSFYRVFGSVCVWFITTHKSTIFSALLSWLDSTISRQVCLKRIVFGSNSVLSSSFLGASDLLLLLKRHSVDLYISHSDRTEYLKDSSTVFLTFGGTGPPQHPPHAFSRFQSSKIPEIHVDAQLGFEFRFADSGNRWNPNIPPPTVGTATSMLFFGDWGRSGDQFDKFVRGQYRKESKDCVFLLGDNFYPAGIEMGQSWSHFHHLSPGTFFAALGNHDYMGDVFAQIGYTGDGWHMPGEFYLVKQDHVCVWVLDTNKGRFTQHQARWLDQSVTSTVCAFRIAVGHHPIYTGGIYRPNAYLIESLLPILHKHAFHMYVAGHEHSSQVLQDFDHPGLWFVVVGAVSDLNHKAISKGHDFVLFIDTRNLAYLAVNSTEPTLLQARITASSGKSLWNTTIRSVQ